MSLLILGLGGPEVMLIVVLALLLFGGKKIPELMNGIGKGVKSFRDGMDGRSSPGDEKGQAADPNASKDSAADNKEANGSADKEANA